MREGESTRTETWAKENTAPGAGKEVAGGRPIASTGLTVSPKSAFNSCSEDGAPSRRNKTREESQMSAPSRRPEIRRRRTRKEKVVQLRKRLAAAASESDRTRLSAKLVRLSRKSPGQPLVKA